MSYSIPVVPRATTATAFQLVPGETTASQIREFAGDAANVGVPDGDERDLRWAIIKTIRGVDQAHYGYWIVKDDLGSLEVLTGDEFAARYAPAGDNAQATLRSRDINDPRVESTKRLAESFAKSLRSE